MSDESMLTYTVPMPGGRKAVLILPFDLTEDEAQRLRNIITTVAFEKWGSNEPTPDQ